MLERCLILVTNSKKLMSLPATSLQLWNNLFQLKSRDAIVQRVYQQLANDFSLTGNAIPFTIELPTEQWSIQLANWLENQHATTIQQLLYIIDLPENFVQNLEASTHYNEQLAEAIIYREMTKVYYKITYSS